MKKLQNHVTFLRTLSGESQMLISKDKNHFRVDTLQLNAPRWQLCDNERHCLLWIFGSKKCHLISSPVKLPVLGTVLFCLIPLDVGFHFSFHPFSQLWGKLERSYSAQGFENRLTCRVFLCFTGTETTEPRRGVRLPMNSLCSSGTSWQRGWPSS